MGVELTDLKNMSSTYRKRILARLREEEKAKENKNDIYVPLKQRKLLDELKSTDFVYESSGSSYATPAQSVDNSDDENDENSKSKQDENSAENNEINIDPEAEKSEEQVLTHEEKLIAEQKSIKK